MIPDTPSPPLLGLADALRHRTTALHRQAEESGIVGAILAGRASPTRYALYLRNLVPAYRELELGLERHRHAPGLGRLFRPELRRSSALEHDLMRLIGGDWRSTLRLLDEADRYARRISLAAEGGGALLIAHAYTRYLGDLAGGRVLASRLATAFDLSPSGLSFYAFPEIADVTAFRRDYRADLDVSGGAVRDLDAVVEEAALAFQLNIDLSEAVQSIALLSA